MIDMSTQIENQERVASKMKRLVLCNKAASGSPYCSNCVHGKPHKKRGTCDMTFNTGCKARPWVGRVKCIPYAENDPHEPCDKRL